jgi:hypothetical protein
MLMPPPPVVVDTDVLIRNLEYFVKRGYPGALLGQASGNYSLVSGVVLFAAAEVYGEAMRHLPEVAQRQNVSIEQVRHAWNQLVVPRYGSSRWTRAQSTTHALRRFNASTRQTCTPLH